MNPQGIAVFYGALSEETAIAEVRPPVGSRVGVGRFELLRPVKLLDVAALRDVLVQGSIFDASFLRRLEHATFLERLSYQISQAVMPNDEPFDYLVTQAIAEYLSEIREPPLDGIIFDSAQVGKGGSNIVLFHPSCRVRPIELPAGTKISADLGHMTDEGFDTDYFVWEEVPKPTSNAEEESTPGLIFEPPVHATLNEFSDYDDRPETLQLDLESVAVHHVAAVKHTTRGHAVRRYRREKGDEVF